MKLVRFVHPWSVYNADETAGFEDATADKLIRAGVAVDADAVAAPAPAPETPAPAPAPKKAAAQAAAAASLPQQGGGADTQPGGEG